MWFKFLEDTEICHNSQLSLVVAHKSGTSHIQLFKVKSTAGNIYINYCR